MFVAVGGVTRSPTSRCSGLGFGPTHEEEAAAWERFRKLLAAGTIFSIDGLQISAGTEPAAPAKTWFGLNPLMLIGGLIVVGLMFAGGRR